MLRALLLCCCWMAAALLVLQYHLSAYLSSKHKQQQQQQQQLSPRRSRAAYPKSCFRHSGFCSIYIPKSRRKPLREIPSVVSNDEHSEYLNRLRPSHSIAGAADDPAWAAPPVAGVLAWAAAAAFVPLKLAGLSHVTAPSTV